MLDPTRDELLAELTDVVERWGENAEEAEASIECALYWLAADCHGGQWTNLYAALSQSPWTPGASESGPEYPCERALYEYGLTYIGHDPLKPAVWHRENCGHIGSGCRCQVCGEVFEMTEEW